MFSNICYFNFTLQLKVNFIPPECSLFHKLWSDMPGLSLSWAGHRPELKHWGINEHSTVTLQNPAWFRTLSSQSVPRYIWVGNVIKQYLPPHTMHCSWRTVLLSGLYTALCTWGSWTHWFNSSDWEKNDFQSCITMLNYCISAISSSTYRVPKTG